MWGRCDIGLTYEQCVRLGIESEHPDHPGRKADIPVVARAAPKRIAVNVKGQNKTEARFDFYLFSLKIGGTILDYWFEPLKLRIAGNTWYRIDFLIKRQDGSLVGVEIKGFMRDDASIKIKDAAEDHPWLDIYLVRKDRLCQDGWDVRRVTRTGIGRHPTGRDWLG